MPFRKVQKLLIVCSLLAFCPASAAEPLIIGFVAPTTGIFAPIGSQMTAGAKAAAQKAGMRLTEKDEVCTEEGGAAAARALVADGVKLVVGFTCLESLTAALPILRDAGITTITTGVRADALTDTKEKSGFLLYRLAPREDMEIAALTEKLLVRWRSENFAIIDDGTVHARNTAEALRFSLTEAGLKPVFTDTFRPGLDNQAGLVRRLQKAGATHVFIGGDIEDALVIASQAKSELEIAVGETGNPEQGAPATGTILGVALPDYTLMAESAEARLAIQSTGIVPDNIALTAYAAVEIAGVLGDRDDVSEALATNTFQTAIGAIAFDEKGDLKANPFKLMTLRDGQFAPSGSDSQ